MEKEGWHRYERDFEQGNRKRKPGGGIKRMQITTDKFRNKSNNDRTQMNADYRDLKYK
jgi:hypothetical protein